MANAGAGAGSFAAGFAKSISEAILRNRQEARAERIRKEEREDRLRQVMLPVLLENVEDPADLDAWLSPTATDTFAGAKQGKKNRGTVTSAVGRFMKGGLLGRGGVFRGDETPTTGTVTEAMAPAAAQAPITAPAAGPGKVVMTDLDTGAPIGEAPAVPRRTLMGVPILSAEEKIERGIGRMETETTAKVELARRMLPRLQEVDPTATMDDALAVVGIRTPSATARQQATMQAVHGVDAEGNEVAAVFDRSKGAYVYPVGHAKAGQPIPGFVQSSTARQTFGVDREAIAQATFGKPFVKLDEYQKRIVLREENLKLQEEASARAVGGMQGRFQGPIDVKTAQETGLPAGVSGAQVAGQAIPTQQQLERRRSVMQLQQGLTDIRDRLLVALPKETELQGLAPGAAYALRRRLPQYRNNIASLESAINNVVNVMARAVGEQRGTQTERDAMRAEAAIASLQDALLTGDTQESATRRINESLGVLERILTQLPQPAVPTGTPGAMAQPGVTPVQPTEPTRVQAQPGVTPQRRRLVQNAAGAWVEP